VSRHTFELPDLITASPLSTFEFSPSAKERAAAILSGGPDAIFHSLMRDQESEASLLAARKVIYSFLVQVVDAPADEPPVDVDGDLIAEQVGAVREQIAHQVDALTRLGPDLRESVLRQRAPIGLAGGCWLDVISQPATQPSVIVNDLFRQHFLLKGSGNTQRSLYHQRRRVLEDAAVYLPEIGAEDFLRKAHARPLTSLHATFYVALSRLPASFLPEVVGVHHAFHSIGVDDLLSRTRPPLEEAALRDVLTRYLALTQRSADGRSERRRLHAAVRLVLRLEREHVAMLTELAEWLGGLSLDAQVAAIVARHAPFAGRQHGKVRVGDRLLTETFADPNLDLAAFLTRLRQSPHLKPLRTGGCRFLNAIKFGGPMFGIFDEREASTLKRWTEAVHAGRAPETEVPINRVGDDLADRWSDAIAHNEPADVVFVEASPLDDRELFYRLVNFEHFPNTLAQARERAARAFADAEVMFTHGASGTFSDASYFEYGADALLARVDDIYWGRLVGPYQPLDEIPDREEVLFGQTLLALAALVDGVWACRIGNLGRFQRRSDALLFSVYADEMGLGDVRKNHIALIRQVLSNLSILLPHIRDEGFKQQPDLPDSTYGYALHQMCISLFPDTFYNEILGFNLGIELSGLGRQRMHEMQKLRAHGLDTSYEDVHLSIDNFSTGHARQAVDTIVTYLDDVARTCGSEAVQTEWRRIWRGYAAFAYFAEYDLVRKLSDSGEAPNENEEADLVI
jgi:hypothetical protein